MIIPNWLSKRPIYDEDPPELRQLTLEGDDFCFGKITVNVVKKFFHENSRDSFYKLVRILGFYGVTFDGKLLSYSGPNEKYPDVLCIPVEKCKDKVASYLTGTNISSLFHSCGIHYLKQLHGVPVKSFVKLYIGYDLSRDANCNLFPFSIVPVHEDFFNLDSSNQPGKLLSKTLESMTLSFRTESRLKSINICFIGDIIQKNDDELLSIPHFEKKCLNEIKEKLSYVGLKNGLQVEQIPDDETIYRESEELSGSIEALHLSERSVNCLRKAEINTIGELIQKKDFELLSIHSFGRKSLNEIQGKLTDVRIQLRLNKKPQFRIIDEIDFTSKEILSKLNSQIKDFILSVRSRNCLKEKGIQYMWQLVQVNEKELLEVRSMGRKSFKEIKELIKSFGFGFGVNFSQQQIKSIIDFKQISDNAFSKEWLRKTATELVTNPLTFLNHKQKIIVKNRIWKVSNKSTLDNIARDFGLTRERVRQIEESALKMIKQQYSKELRKITSHIKQQIEKLGGIASISELDIDLLDISLQEQLIISSLISLENKKIYIDWFYSLISLNGDSWITQVLDDIQEVLQEKTLKKGLFSSIELEEAAKKVIKKHKICSKEVFRNIIRKFYKEKNVNEMYGNLCFGKFSKQDAIVLAFKEAFPQGLEIYKKQDILIKALGDFDEKKLKYKSSRALIARLTAHPDILLWNRGFFVHRDNVIFDLNLVKQVTVWLHNHFEKGHSRFQTEIPFSVFRSKLTSAGIPNQYALYTVLRIMKDQRIGLRKFPTIVDLESDVDISTGILEELESYFLEQRQSVPYSQVKNEFVFKRGWKEYSLQQNIILHSDVIYPWQQQTYIHIEYLPVGNAKLLELIEALRQKLNSIKSAYSLKGAKNELSVLWEQSCPSATVRTMIKLIRSIDPEDLQIDRYFIRLSDSSTESVSAAAEIEDYFLDKGTELSKYDLQDEFYKKRGWTENQLNVAIRKANLFKSGKSTLVHPATIHWNELLSQEVHQILAKHLNERNESNQPHMQIEELIYQYALPDLPNDVQWTRQLLRSIGEELGDFLFFDDAYIFVDNNFDIDDLDDMIGFLIGRNFKLGIAKKEKVEELLWREGILESGRAIPSNQFFGESSIKYLKDSEEVALSLIGRKRYGNRN